MRNLPQPEFLLKEVYTSCVNDFTDEEKKKRLNDCLTYILGKEKAYLELKGVKLLYSLTDEICSELSIEKKELKSVYKQKFSAEKGPGRDTYLKIRSASPQNTCPTCGQRKVTTLDHYLAQTHYPSLVVAPINLVPSCFDCNKKKLSSKPSTHLEETLHPYLDDLGDERFLYMEIKEDKELNICFYISKASMWDEDFYYRVQFHFKDMDLNELYISHAVDEIIGNLDIWREMNSLDLKQHLIELSNSRRKIDLNCWQVALFEGLSNSEWFCEEGVKSLF
ncbi:hypothetical protein [Psychrobacillus lasiicapitis]|uniref:HNH endonuclease n=1 Tax=Psychrobacillus lasiicapitis TaxID=1636719 RepID=A0A544T1T8_9BACI|nr:hypothetical protein [Psychrobacillus lasiicapitis]TQR11409.1 hypothetical protein FG382_15805 [Psychrobacillus lasiicapitis]GGA40784.1 HNH endonuclease [Psychrobacillus lasiicapitis]